MFSQKNTRKYVSKKLLAQITATQYVLEMDKEEKKFYWFYYFILHIPNPVVHHK